MKKPLLKLIHDYKEWRLLVILFCLFHSQFTYSESYTLSVGESVTISQTPYSGGYIDNEGLADYIDAHLHFTKNSDGSATITVNSYFDYTATVKLVFIERYQSYYSGRYHTRAATYYKNVYIKCNYVAPKPNVKPTKVSLPEKVRVPIDQRVYINPIYEPYGAKGTDVSWFNTQGTATFAYGTSDDGSYHVTGRSAGLGEVRVLVDNNLKASTIIEVVDPDHLPPTEIFLPNSIEISVGGHATLEPILVPEGTSTSYTWSTSNSSVATVSYGKVMGVKTGTATITVKTANDLESTCKVTVVSQNGKDDEEENDNPTIGTIDGHDYVDLGLSVKWATTNVGASQPEAYGNYYAWGETQTKSTYSWNTYKYGSNVMNCQNIGTDISGTKYDAAYVNWGKNWRMPTNDEAKELVSKCTFAAVTKNGVEGFEVTGPNGNSIFLPSAGTKFTTVRTGCWYWTATSSDIYGYALLISKKNSKITATTLNTLTRPYGVPIRAVTIASPSNVLVTSITIYPSSEILKVGDTMQLTATISPDNATDRSVTWSSNKTSVATVSSNGLVTAVGEGTATITCKANDSSGISATCSITVTPSSTDAVEIDATNFPDEAFRSYLLSQSYGSDGKLTKEEISQITVIDVSGSYPNKGNITNLKGLEYFTALKQLWCSSNQLTSLDVSKNTALVYLNCAVNQLTSLDVSKNTALDWLQCSSNQLTSLDVSKNMVLYELACYSNQLTSLDLSNIALNTLACYSNQLTSLDVSKNTALKYLDCDSNQLTSLDVSNNTALKTLRCSFNQLTSLDLSKNTALETLWCSSNQLTSLDVSKNTVLETLHVDINQIRGTAMDDLINSLHVNTSDKEYGFYVISDNSKEGNICTTTQVAAAKTKGWIPKYFEGWYWKDYEGSELNTPGDVNSDNLVNVTDIVATVNYIMEKPSEGFNKDAADLNGDGEINVTDIVKMVSIIMSGDAARRHADVDE